MANLKIFNVDKLTHVDPLKAIEKQEARITKIDSPKAQKLVNQSLKQTKKDQLTTIKKPKYVRPDFKV